MEAIAGDVPAPAEAVVVVDGAVVVVVVDGVLPVLEGEELPHPARASTAAASDTANQMCTRRDTDHDPFRRPDAGVCRWRAHGTHPRRSRQLTRRGGRP
jgi:hypothetical protein